MYGKAIALFDVGGLILGEDNRKYKYKNINIKNEKRLYEGQSVQFAPRIDEAVDIIAAKKKVTISKNSDQSKNLKKHKISPPGAKVAGFGVFLQMFLVIPFFGFILYLIGVIIQLLGIKKLARHKESLIVHDYLIKGLLSGFIVIFIVISCLFYLGTDIFSIEASNMPIYLLIPFSILFINAIYATVMVYKALSILGKKYNCDMLKSTAWLHAIFLMLVPFGIGLIVFYVYVIILSIALFNLKIVR